MPKTPAFSEFGGARSVTSLPRDVSEAILSVVGSRSAAPRADPQPDPTPERESYFEIYRAERVTLTSILFSGGDWRWRFCSASGEPIAVSVGYGSEQACAAAVAALRSGAGSANVRGGHMR